MAYVTAEILSFLGTLIAVPGMLSMVFAVAYLAYQSAAFLVLNHSADELYRYRSQSLTEVRTLVILPTISVAVAVIAGIGVNLATDAEVKDGISTGTQLIFVGLMVIAIVGLMMVVTHRPVSPSRMVEIRLARISTALDDPFVSVERAVQLRPEVLRYVKLGERIAQRHSVATFRGWVREALAERDIRVCVLGGYGSAVAALLLAGWRALATRGESSSAGMFTFFTLAIMGGFLGPALHFQNYRQRCLRFGTLLRTRSRAILANIDALEKKYGLPLVVHREPSSPPPTTIRVWLRRLWNVGGEG